MPSHSWARFLPRPEFQILMPAVLLAACAAPAALNSQPGDIVKSVDQRDLSHIDVGEVIEIARLEAIELPLPSAEDLADPAQKGYWQACAYTWNPAVRASRRGLESAVALAESAGAPSPMSFQAMLNQASGGSGLLVGQSSVELTRLLGMGPSAAERELATTEVLEATVGLELALWNAGFAVERSRVTLAAVRARYSALDKLNRDLREDRVRLKILNDHGRLPAAAWEGVEARTAALDAAVSRLHVLEKTAESMLSRASGLPMGHPSLAVPAWNQIPHENLDAGSWPQNEELLARHPLLRVRRISLSIAEAQLREVASKAWPSIRLGVETGLNPATLPFAGLLSLQWPFPSSWRGKLEAAEARRARQLERIEESYLDQIARVDQAHATYENALIKHHLYSPSMEWGAEAMWRASRARLHEGLEPMSEWFDFFDKRLGSVHLVMDAWEYEQLSRIGLQKELGPGSSNSRPVQPSEPVSEVTLWTQ